MLNPGDMIECLRASSCAQVGDVCIVLEANDRDIRIRNRSYTFEVRQSAVFGHDLDADRAGRTSGTWKKVT